MEIAPLKTYLANIEQALKAGNATEHTHRPALKTFIEQIAAGVTATNEPRRIKCGAPDYIITRGNIPLGYIEAKDVGIVLNDIESDEQLKRYRESLANLILTDYLEFRWYVAGEHRLTVRLARPDKTGKVKLLPDAAEQFAQLMDCFINADIPIINSPRELAIRMAAMARLIRSIIGKTFADEGNEGALHQQMQAFQKVLLHDMTAPQFGDMYAQTICYGLFAARCNFLPSPASGREAGGEGGAGNHFTRAHAAYDLPKTNPFLRKMFGHIAGPELDERIVWAVDDLAELLARADISAILQDFGSRTRQEDPVVHFYETFLGHYDPKMREARGVYYTPEPVVSYIVRSVDAILKTDFKLALGLADASRIKLKRPLKLNKKGETQFETIETHKVQILDPATGTGTFLYWVIEQIRAAFQGNAGMWPGYVAQNLLPRIYGFELLMAPYAVAHMKLGLQLRDSGYDFEADERLRVYLTNTLEEAHAMTGLPLFTQWLAEEANSASAVKQDAPVMVVLGNPPYSGHSANTGAWIAGLLRGRDTATGKATGNYFEVDGGPLGERNPKWLNDDYVKFIRFAQWRIEQTGYGVLAFVTNHGYLDNPTFRGMRQSLMQTFDDIYLLDLHGNAKKKEKAPDGGKDENVFDIQQGVAIGIFVKRTPSPQPQGERDFNSPRPQAGEGQGVRVRVSHAELFGLREGKYQWLAERDLAGTEWCELQPQAPFYLFVPQDERLRAEYEQGWKITDIMPVNSVGIVTARDALTIHWSREDAWHTVTDFASLPSEEAREKYELGKDARDWQVAMAQADLKASGPIEARLVPVLYRPFDVRHTYYTGNSRGFHCMPRGEVMRHMLAGNNIGFHICRQTSIPDWAHVFATNLVTDDCYVSNNTSERGYTLPLYLEPSTSKTDLFDEPAAERRANLNPEFITAFSAKLGIAFSPEDFFHYAYAVFHSPTYRSRYAEFLKIDFPRLPLTSDVALFRALCGLGERLVWLHLMEEMPSPPAPLPPAGEGSLKVRYPIAGDNKVETVRYEEPSPPAPLEKQLTNPLSQQAGKWLVIPPAGEGRVWINATQYFEGVPPEVWNFHVGGYQVAHKWLKDRKGRQLSYDDLTHYQQVMAALAETIKLQTEIDEAIGEWPIQ